MMGLVRMGQALFFSWIGTKRKQKAYYKVPHNHPFLAYDV